MSLAYYQPRKGIVAIGILPNTGRPWARLDSGVRYFVPIELLWLLRGRLAILSYDGGPKRGRMIEERVRGLLDDDVLIGRSGPAPVGVLRRMRGLGADDREEIS